MKRFVLGLLLATLLVLGAASACLAAPPAGGGTGVFFFGEYAPYNLYEPMNAFAVGAGYGFSDNFAAGLQVQVIHSDFTLGGFANLGIGPVVISGEFYVIPPMGGIIIIPVPLETREPVLFSGNSVGVKIKAAYVFDLSPVQLSIGAGSLFFLGNTPPEDPWYIEGAARVGLGDHFSLYGKIDYFLASPYPWDMTFDLGVSLAL